MKRTIIILLIAATIVLVVVRWWLTGPSYEKYEVQCPHPIRFVKFAPSGNKLAVVLDGDPFVRDDDSLIVTAFPAVRDGKLIPLPRGITGICWSPTSSVVYLSSDDEIFAYDVAADNLEKVVRTGGSILTLSCEGAFLSVLTANETAEVYAIQAPARVTLQFVREKCIGAVLVSHNRQIMLALVDWDGSVVLSDWASRTETRFCHVTHRDRGHYKMQYRSPYLLYRQWDYPPNYRRLDEPAGTPSSVLKEFVSPCRLSRESITYFRDSSLSRFDIATRRTSTIASGFFAEHRISALDTLHDGGTFWVAAGDPSGRLTIFRSK